MGNFYRDNKDIEDVIDLLDLTEVATLLEEDFKFAKEYDFAPKDAADAIDNYKRAIDLCGDIMANRIAPLADAATSWRTASPRSRRRPTSSATR